MQVSPSDPLRTFKIVGVIMMAIAIKSGAGLKGQYVSALRSATASLEERMEKVVNRTTTAETAGLRQELDLLHARIE